MTLHHPTPRGRHWVPRLLNALLKDTQDQPRNPLILVAPGRE